MAEIDIGMNAELRKNARNYFEKYFSKLINNWILGRLWRLWENIEISSLQQLKQEGTI